MAPPMSHGVRTPSLAAEPIGQGRERPPGAAAGRGCRRRCRARVAGRRPSRRGRARGSCRRAGRRASLARGHGRRRDDETERAVGIAGRRAASPRPARSPARAPAGSLRLDVPAAAAAAAAAATTGTVVAGRGPSSSAPAIADSYSATDAKTGRPGRRREGPRRRIAGHDRQPLLVGQRIARQQPEVDPRRGDPRAVRQDDRDPRRVASRGCAPPPR